MVGNYYELGENLYKVVQRLLADDDLIKLIYYPNIDPLIQQTLTPEQKQELIFNKLIKTIPYVGQSETDKTQINIIPAQTGSNTNPEFNNVTILITTIHPLSTWFIRDINLRPFLIMGHIKQDLDNKTINGLGKMTGGDFQIRTVTNDVCIYDQYFTITAYD